MKTDTKSSAELRELLIEKDNEITRLKQQVEWLTEQFRLMQARQYGSSSEKVVAVENFDQLSLFNEAEATADPTVPEPELEQITYARKKKKGKREADFSGLPTEQIIHELPDSELVCPECGDEMHACGHDVYRRELTCIPAQYKVTEHVQTAYSCRHCERTSDRVPMKKSDVPAAIIPNSGVASPSLLAQILNNKYTLALPLYRQEQEFKRNSISLSRQTMSNWIITAHQRWFSGLFISFMLNCCKTRFFTLTKQHFKCCAKKAGRPLKKAMCGFTEHPATHNGPWCCMIISPAVPVSVPAIFWMGSPENCIPTVTTLIIANCRRRL